MQISSRESYGTYGPEWSIINYHIFQIDWYNCKMNTMNGEPDALKVASPVRRRARASNCSLVGVGRPGPILHSTLNENTKEMVVFSAIWNIRNHYTVIDLGVRFLSLPPKILGVKGKLPLPHPTKTTTCRFRLARHDEETTGYCLVVFSSCWYWVVFSTLG